MNIPPKNVPKIYPIVPNTLIEEKLFELASHILTPNVSNKL